MLSVLAALYMSQAADELHPAFYISQKSFDAIWAKGVADGKRQQDPNKVLSDKFGRQIDSFYVSLLAKEPCSWAHLMHPKTAIYYKACTDTKKYLPDDEQKKDKEALAYLVGKEPRFIYFDVIDNEMPSFKAPYGRLAKYADPDNLTDVRCVLKVGDRVIQPVEQPGDISTGQADMVQTFAFPVTTYINGQSNGSAYASGSNGNFAFGTSNVQTAYQVTQIETGETPYSIYKGRFKVAFPLRDDIGHPNILPSDKEVVLTVVKKHGEMKSRFPLGDWVNALEK